MREVTGSSPVVPTNPPQCGIKIHRTCFGGFFPFSCRLFAMPARGGCWGDVSTRRLAAAQHDVFKNACTFSRCHMTYFRMARRESLPSVIPSAVEESPPYDEISPLRSLRSLRSKWQNRREENALGMAEKDWKKQVGMAEKDWKKQVERAEKGEKNREGEHLFIFRNKWEKIVHFVYLSRNIFVKKWSKEKILMFCVLICAYLCL